MDGPMKKLYSERTVIDKNLFPKEYATIESLKERSRRFERDLLRRRTAKQAMIEECRRKLNGQSSE